MASNEMLMDEATDIAANAELTAWLARFGDQPDAPAIRALLDTQSQRQPVPAAAAPAKPAAKAAPTPPCPPTTRAVAPGRPSAGRVQATALKPRRLRPGAPSPPCP